MSEPSYVHPLSTAGLNEVPPQRCLHSVGTLAELYSLPAQTIRRALDRAVKRGLLSPLLRAGSNQWRLVPTEDLPAVEAALRELGYPVTSGDHPC
jgi:hypothetical protein